MNKLKKHIVNFHYMAVVNIVLYFLIGNLYQENATLSVYLFFILIMIIAATVAVELYILFTKSKVHKLIAVILIPVNIIVAGNCVFAVMLTNVGFLG